MASQRDVEFKTYDGLKLRGTLFPAGEKKPCVIMTAGFGGERAHFNPDIAAYFQKAGFTVLSYDNRNLGDSEGLPRNEVDPELQTRDYFDAFNYAATLPEVDPKKIVYWGSSFSGGVVLKAAALNKNIAAVIAQVPFISGEWVSRTVKQPPAGLVLERGHAIATGQPTMIPSLPDTTEEITNGTSKAVLADQSTIAFMEEISRRGYTWDRRVTVQSMANTCLFEPLAYVHRIAPTPLFMVVADNDTVTGTHLQLEAFERARQPKKLQLFAGEDHFSMYYGEALERNVTTQIEFLKETLHL
ncbi:Alpha/Beta hydrolase protein [Microdochium trichocladiopsis]|uniref:Alpha/Beta hydrolase protein n=1 Tax=Microdochium trichocladiopsis TaxID=1682393 RepID=A0A9P8YFH4_9PEZI|nr:Alpha/Beta hydrolase protein [Microdochium trichocladiopsis]KAH7036033.1 Alpha/Beta hydrolase protein [Microdochium trichocladiopsis]